MNLWRKKQITKMIEKYRSDYQLATIITSGWSACMNIAFALFNGVFGLIFLSVWHLSICVYYAFLLGIRGYILVSIRKKRAPRTVYWRTHIFLILMNIFMIIPVAVMVNGERNYTFGLIPAIATAAYTTCRITMASIQLKKSRTSSSFLIKELRIINFIDALMAIMALQNTLIMAKGGMTEEMRTFCAWSNAGILLLILYVIIHSFFRLKRSTAISESEHHAL